METGKDIRHPWLGVPASDYEGHICPDGAAQLAPLNQLFAERYGALRPARLLVLGSATGNGFEHVDGALTERALGIDFHPQYVALARQRFADRSPPIVFDCQDLSRWHPPQQSFDWVYAALIFEYLPSEALLDAITHTLTLGGTLTVVLQQASVEAGVVSTTRYESLRALAPTLNLVPPPGAARGGSDAGLGLLQSTHCCAARRQVLLRRRLDTLAAQP